MHDSTSKYDFVKASVKGSIFLLRNASCIKLASLPYFLFMYFLHHFITEYPPPTFLGYLGFKITKELDYVNSHYSEIESQVNLLFLGGLLKCISATSAEGHIIELGSYRGGTSVCMAHYLKTIHSNRKIYACDTFSGHPYNNSATEKWLMKGSFSETSALYVERKLRKFGVSDKIVVVKGLFEDTLQRDLGKETFSFAFVDCDLYESTKYSLEFLSRRMNDEGIIAVHDYGPDSGAGKAVNEWCRTNGFKIVLFPIPHIDFSDRIRKTNAARDRSSFFRPCLSTLKMAKLAREESLSSKPRKLEGMKGRIVEAYVKALQTVQRATSISFAPQMTLREFLQAAKPKLNGAADSFAELTFMAERTLYSLYMPTENDAKKADDSTLNIQGKTKLEPA